MKKITLILLTFLFTQLLYAQSDQVNVQNRFSVKVGISHLSLKDRVFSPIKISGIVPRIELAFEQKKQHQTLWSSGITVNYGNLDYKGNLFPTTAASLQLYFNYLKGIKSSKNANIYLGGQYNSTVNLLDYDGFSSGSWYSAQQFEAILKYQFSISRKQLVEIQLSYPLASLVSRPDYAGLDEFVVVNSDKIPKILYSNLKVYSLNKLFNPRFALVYSHQLEKTLLSLTASYEYLQVNSIRRYFENGWSLSIGVHF